MSAKFVPLDNRVMVKRTVAEVVSKGGLHIPLAAKEKTTEGDIIAIGDGRLDDKGNRIPMRVAVGDHVLFQKYGGSEITLDDGDYLVLSENDILGILR